MGERIAETVGVKILLRQGTMIGCDTHQRVKSNAAEGDFRPASPLFV